MVFGLRKLSRDRLQGVHRSGSGDRSRDQITTEDFRIQEGLRTRERQAGSTRSRRRQLIALR
jgi:hypothetical protein